MSKLDKFRYSPEQFFADSQYPWVQALGRRLGPRIARSELAMSLLEDPVEGMARNPFPLVRGLAERLRRRQATRREAVLRRADNPTVSVVVAARNAENSIARSVRSILDQSYPATEVVVVDDASEDHTAAVVRSEATSRLNLIRNSKPSGAAAARNIGMAAATGQYLTFQDADDLSHPERLERQLAALVDAEDAVVSVCNYVRETPEGVPVEINGRRVALSRISMMFERETVLNTIGYMTDLEVGEDTEYHERIRAVFGRAREVHLFETLYRARFSSDSLLFSSGTTAFESNSVRFEPSLECQERLHAALSRVEAMRREEIDPFVPFSVPNARPQTV